MTELELGVENRYSIREMLNLYQFTCDNSDKKSRKNYIKNKNMVLNIFNKVDFTDEEVEKFGIVDDLQADSFTFNIKSNIYVPFEFEEDELKFLFDNVYNTLMSPHDFNTMFNIFKVIKNEYAFDDIKELTITNVTELNNVRYLLMNIIGVETEHFNYGTTSWLEFLMSKKIDIELIKNIVMLDNFLTIDADTMSELGIVLEEKDGRFHYSVPEDFSITLQIPEDILNTIETKLFEIGHNLTVYKILNKVFGMFDEK